MRMRTCVAMLACIACSASAEDVDKNQNPDWLCTTSYAAEIHETNGRVESPRAGVYNARFVVTPRGLIDESTGYFVLGPCEYYQGAPHSCGRADPDMAWEGHFQINIHRVFTLIGYSAKPDLSSTWFYLYRGNCRPR